MDRWVLEPIDPGGVRRRVTDPDEHARPGNGRDQGPTSGRHPRRSDDHRDRRAAAGPAPAAGREIPCDPRGHLTGPRPAAPDRAAGRPRHQRPRRPIGQVPGGDHSRPFRRAGIAVDDDPLRRPIGPDRRALGRVHPVRRLPRPGRGHHRDSPMRGVAGECASPVDARPSARDPLPPQVSSAQARPFAPTGGSPPPLTTSTLRATDPDGRRRYGVPASRRTASCSARGTTLPRCSSVPCP